MLFPLVAHLLREGLRSKTSNANAFKPCCCAVVASGVAFFGDKLRCCVGVGVHGAQLLVSVMNTALTSGFFQHARYVRLVTLNLYCYVILLESVFVEFDHSLIYGILKRS